MASPHSPREAAHGGHGSHMKDTVVAALSQAVEEGDLEQFCAILEGVEDGHLLALEPNRAHPQGYAAIHQVSVMGIVPLWPRLNLARLLAGCGKERSEYLDVDHPSRWHTAFSRRWFKCPPCSLRRICARGQSHTTLSSHTDRVAATSSLDSFRECFPRQPNISSIWLIQIPIYHRPPPVSRLSTSPPKMLIR